MRRLPPEGPAPAEMPDTGSKSAKYVSTPQCTGAVARIAIGERRQLLATHIVQASRLRALQNYNAGLPPVAGVDEPSVVHNAGPGVLRWVKMTRARTQSEEYSNTHTQPQTHLLIIFTASLSNTSRLPRSSTMMPIRDKCTTASMLFSGPISCPASHVTGARLHTPMRCQSCIEMKSPPAPAAGTRRMHARRTPTNGSKAA